MNFEDIHWSTLGNPSAEELARGQEVAAAIRRLVPLRIEALRALGFEAVNESDFTNFATWMEAGNGEWDEFPDGRLISASVGAIEGEIAVALALGIADKIWWAALNEGETACWKFDR